MQHLVTHHGHDHRSNTVHGYVHQHMAPPAGTQTRQYQPLWTRRAKDEVER